MTIAEQLALILPWLNGDLPNEAAVRRALWRFIEVRGRTGALRSPHGFSEAYGLVHGARASDLEAVRSKVVKLLAAGIDRPFHPRGDQRGKQLLLQGDLLPFMAFPSLRFGVHKGSMEIGGNEMRLRDLVPFLVLLLLAGGDLKGKRALQWCQAPEPGSWSLGWCGRFFIWTGGRGRPLKFCSDNCRTRHKDREKKTAKPKRRQR